MTRRSWGIGLMGAVLLRVLLTMILGQELDLVLMTISGTGLAAGAFLLVSGKK